jgi:hypothetical protein
MNGIVGVLQKIRAGFAGKFVHGRLFSPDSSVNPFLLPDEKRLDLHWFSKSNKKIGTDSGKLLQIKKALRKGTLKITVFF